LICPICSEKCDVQEEGVNNFPIQIFKQILKNWKTNIIKEIYEYEKSASKITEKELESGVRIFGIGFWNNSHGTVMEIQVEPIKELRIKKFSDLYWSLIFNSNGRLEDISAND
jgi:hypothetical protein